MKFTSKLATLFAVSVFSLSGQQTANAQGVSDYSQEFKGSDFVEGQLKVVYSGRPVVAKLCANSGLVVLLVKQVGQQDDRVRIKSGSCVFYTVESVIMHDSVGSLVFTLLPNV